MANARCLKGSFGPDSVPLIDFNGLQIRSKKSKLGCSAEDSKINMNMSSKQKMHIQGYMLCTRSPLQNSYADASIASLIRLIGQLILPS